MSQRKVARILVINKLVRCASVVSLACANCRLPLTMSVYSREGCQHWRMLPVLVVCWIQLQAGFVSSQVPSKGLAPTNVTVITSARSLVVTWDPPDYDFQPSSLESYRIRLYAGKKSQSPKRVHWVPSGDIRRETISCLQPETSYKVQVFARFIKESNLTDGGSEVKIAKTKEDPEHDFLAEVEEQKVFVGLGAGLAVVCCLNIFGVCWCCRNCRVTRKVSLNSDVEDECRQKKKKKKRKPPPMLPSAKELREIEQGRPRANTPASGQPSRSWSHSQPSNGNDTTSVSHLVPLSSPVSSYKKSSRPYMPPPPEVDDLEDDVFDNIYQNTACELSPPSYPADDMPVYGNVVY